MNTKIQAGTEIQIHEDFGSKEDGNFCSLCLKNDLKSFFQICLDESDSVCDSAELDMGDFIEWPICRKCADKFEPNLVGSWY